MCRRCQFDVRSTGVPPVSIRVIVRSAHSAPVRKLCNPRSLFYLLYMLLTFVCGGVPHLSISKDRAGVPPVSAHVIVRYAHSALVRKLCNPRSLFYLLYMLLTFICGGVPHLSIKVTTASYECSVRVQSGTEWSDSARIDSGGTPPLR